MFHHTGHTSTWSHQIWLIWYCRVKVPGWLVGQYSFPHTTAQTPKWTGLLVPESLPFVSFNFMTVTLELVKFPVIQSWLYSWIASQLMFLQNFVLQNNIPRWLEISQVRIVPNQDSSINSRRVRKWNNIQICRTRYKYGGLTSIRRECHTRWSGD